MQVIEAQNEEHEAERVVARIDVSPVLNKTAYRDYAILYRGNHQSRLLEKTLMQK